MKRPGPLDKERGATMRHVVLTVDEEGWWVAEVPSLPGCLTQGETRAEALENIKEAIELYLESLHARALPIPEDRIAEVAEVAV